MAPPIAQKPAARRPKRASAPPADPVTAYARAVTTGAVAAGRLVRLACARHLADLETAAARGLVWRVDEAIRVIEFFAEILCLPEETAAGDELEADDVREADATPAAGRPFL